MLFVVCCFLCCKPLMKDIIGFYTGCRRSYWDGKARTSLSLPPSPLSLLPLSRLPPLSHLLPPAHCLPAGREVEIMFWSGTSSWQVRLNTAVHLGTRLTSLVVFSRQSRLFRHFEFVPCLSCHLVTKLTLSLLSSCVYTDLVSPVIVSPVTVCPF